MRCRHCNSKLKRYAKFCPECGMTAIWEDNPKNDESKNGARKLIITIILLLVVAVVVALSLGGIAPDIVHETSVPKINFSDDPNAISIASQSVVKLNCYNKNGELFATGSGFACFADNVIVTNYHVIEGGAYSIEVLAETGDTFEIAYVLATDEKMDIAILGTSAPHNLALLQPGDSSALQKGEKVVAIGSPLGLLNSVSTGVFSGYVYEDEIEVLQFTAPISSGSSGGVLFNNAGEVLGITFASYKEGQNLNLAIPISLVAQVSTDNPITMEEFYKAASSSVILDDRVVTLGSTLAIRTITLSSLFDAELELALWELGEATEATMIAMMDEIAPGQGGGQLYLIDPGVFTEEIDAWCFDPSRQPGDYAIIENPYGYSICFISMLNQ